MIRIMLAALILLMPFTAPAEELAAGISRDKIEINSSFRGTEVAIFGSVEPAIGEVVEGDRARDIVVVVRSDRLSRATVRKKELVGPVWINRDAREFVNVPEFYFVATNRPLKDIAAPSVLQQFELGLDNIVFGPAPGVIGGPTAFRKALLDSRVASELYAQHEGAVSFMSGTLFRTTLALPPNVPAGNLRIQVFSFHDGQITSSNSMTLFIEKTGIERALSEFSQREPLFYGLTAVFFSVLAGFLAAVAFRERH